MLYIFYWFNIYTEIPKIIRIAVIIKKKIITEFFFSILTLSPTMTLREHVVALLVHVFSWTHQLQAQVLVTHALHLRERRKKLH